MNKKRSKSKSRRKTRRSKSKPKSKTYYLRLLKRAQKKLDEWERRLAGPEGWGMSGSGTIATRNAWKRKVDKYKLKIQSL
jgi:hypothetical protein